MHRFRTLLLGLALGFAPVAAMAAGVNVNAADAATLARGLQDVGTQKAQAIVAYRKQHGPFKKVDDLTQVKGIGEKTVDENRDRITLK